MIFTRAVIPEVVPNVSGWPIPEGKLSPTNK